MTCIFLIKVTFLLHQICTVSHSSPQLLHPRYDNYISPEQRADFRSQVQEIVGLLGSPEVAIDDRHNPKVYSRLLQGLLSSPVLNRPHPESESKSYMVQKLNNPDISWQPEPPQKKARQSVKPEMTPSSATGGFHVTQNTAPRSELPLNGPEIQPLPFEELIQSVQDETNFSWNNFEMPGKI